MVIRKSNKITAHVYKSQSQSTAPCPVIHLSIMYEVAHKCSASKLASAFSGGLQGGTYDLNYNQHFQAKLSDLTMTNDLIHWQIPSWVGKFIGVNELIFPTVEPPLHWSSAAQSQSCCSRWSSHVCSRRRGRRRAPRHPPRLSETVACWSRAVVLLASGSTAAHGSRASQQSY